MSRPDTVSNEDISRWSDKIYNDPNVSVHLAQNPIIREVLYAGQWLVDRLDALECPDHLIGRMMYTAGQLCFGRKDPWAIHQDMLNKFIDGTLEFDVDPDELN